MKMAILGGTGATGRLTLARALDEGHEVTVLARRPEALAEVSGRLRVVTGGLTDADAVAQTVRNADAVVSTLGSRDGRRPTTVYSDGVAGALAAGAHRIVAVSAVPAAPDEEKSFLERRVVHPLLHAFFGGTYDDMRRMESLLMASEADWTIVRPPRLTNGRPKGHYRTSTGHLQRPSKIARADLAVALVAAAQNRRLSREFLTISY